MKRIAFIMALFLIATMSGVYAAWTYTEDTAEVVDQYDEVLVKLTGLEWSGKLGDFKIDTNLELAIDQKGDDHEAELVFKPATEGETIFLTITFTPSEAASQEIKNNGIPAELYLDTTVPMQYPMDAEGNYDADGTLTDIFTLSNTANGRLDPNVTWVKNDDGTFSATYGVDALKEMIRLSQTFVLDTKLEHDEFGKCLGGNIKLLITDGTVNNESVGG